MVRKADAFRALAVQIAGLGDTRFARDILVLDVRSLTPLTNYQVLMSGESVPQLNALYRVIIDSLCGTGVSPLRKEGNPDTQWIVLDFGGVVVHIMHEDYREFYSLERLWVGGRRVSWRKKKR